MATVPGRHHNAIQCSLREIVLQAGEKHSPAITVLFSHREPYAPIQDDIQAGRALSFSQRIPVTKRKFSDGCRNAVAGGAPGPLKRSESGNREGVAFTRPQPG
jgi:hypothetical protein